MRSRRVRTVALITLLLIVPSASALVVYREARAIGDSDYVEFHFAMYDRDGNLRYTSDADRAAAELEKGNPWLEPNLSARQYRLRAGYVTVAGDEQTDSLNPSRFIIGHREGDIVRTPVFVKPLATTPRHVIPHEIGPVKRVFTIEAQLLADALNREAEQGRTALPVTPLTPDLLVPGIVLPYAGVLTATVKDRVGDDVTLDVQVEDGQVVFSERLGINVVARILSDEHVALRPSVVPGEVFDTASCSIPIDLPAGRYRVVEVSEAGIVVEEAPQRLEPYRNEDLSFEFTIVKANPWSEYLKAKDEAEKAYKRAQVAWLAFSGATPGNS